MQTITVRFPKAGGFVIEASGFTGGACMKATAPFEKALGANDPDRQLKPEAHQAELHNDVTGYVSGAE